MNFFLHKTNFHLKTFPNKLRLHSHRNYFPPFPSKARVLATKSSRCENYQMEFALYFSHAMMLVEDEVKIFNRKKKSDKISTKAYLTFTSNKNIVQHQNFVIFVSFVSMRQHFNWAKKIQSKTIKNETYIIRLTET